MIQSATAGHQPQRPTLRGHPPMLRYHPVSARQERSVKMLLPNAIKKWWDRTTAEWTAEWKAEILAEAYAEGYAAAYVKEYAKAYAKSYGVSRDEAYALAQAEWYDKAYAKGRATRHAQLRSQTANSVQP